MNRGKSIGASAVIHAAMLLGISVMASGQIIVLPDFGTGPAFECGVRGPSLVFDRIDRTPDAARWRSSPSDPGPGLFEEGTSGFGQGGGDDGPRDP